jgi:hypothetical protein
MDLVGCTYTALALRGDGPKAAARLPPGYGLRSEDSAVSDVNLDFLECPSIVAGNQSVLGATTIAFVLAQVEVPKEVEREGASHGYLFEAFSDSDAWIAAAAAWGLPVRKAALASSVTQASSAWTVTVDGATWYSTQDAGGAGPAEDELVRRLHYADPSGGEAWLDVDGHWEFAAVNRPVAVQAAAGVLRDLAPGGQGALAGVGSPGPYSGTMTPGRPS